MKGIFYIYMNYLKNIAGLNHNIVIVNLILELIMYIHELHFKLDYYLVLMNFISYILKTVQKVIPSNIEELLTPVPLAYWAMDDGAKLSSGFLLCTHSFLLSDV